MKNARRCHLLITTESSDEAARTEASQVASATHDEWRDVRYTDETRRVNSIKLLPHHRLTYIAFPFTDNNVDLQNRTSICFPPAKNTHKINNTENNIQ